MCAIAPAASAEKEEDPNRPQLKEVSCSKPQDCNSIDGTYCDVDLGLCLCKPDYPVTDSNHCYKGSSNVLALLANLLRPLPIFLQSPGTMSFANWTSSAKGAIKTPNVIVTSICVSVSHVTLLNLSAMGNSGVSVSVL